MNINDLFILLSSDRSFCIEQVDIEVNSGKSFVPDPNNNEDSAASISSCKNKRKK